MKSIHIFIAALLLPVSVSAAAQDDQPAAGPLENSMPDCMDNGRAPDAEEQGDVLVTEANIDEAEPADEGAEEPEGSARA